MRLQTKGRTIAALGLAISMTLAAGAQLGQMAVKHASNDSTMDRIQTTETESIYSISSERDGMKILQVSFTGEAQQIYNVKASDEMDVYSITISNGLFHTGTSGKGGVSFRVNGVSMHCAFDQYGTCPMPFPEALKLRANDSIKIQATGETITGEVDVTLVGTTPQSSKLVIY